MSNLDFVIHTTGAILLISSGLLWLRTDGKLLNRLVGHFFILSKMRSSIKKAFYEIAIIQNSWSVPLFQENIDNYYFEQNGPEYDLEEAIEQMAETILHQLGIQ